MTTLICILVGLGIILFMCLAGAAVVGALAGLFWAHDKYGWDLSGLQRLVSWEMPRSIAMTLLGILCVLGLGMILWIFYLLGCDVAFHYGWIDDCPTCEVQEG